MNKNRITFILFIVLLILFLSFFLFPRKRQLLDGGTIRYESFGFGTLYLIEYRHKLYSENGNTYYEIGTLVSVLGTEIYNDVHVDYDNTVGSEPSPEDATRLNNAIESALAG